MWLKISQQVGELNLLNAGLMDQLGNVGGRNRDGFAGHTDGC